VTLIKKTQNKNLSKAGKPRHRGTGLALFNSVPASLANHPGSWYTQHT